MQGKHREKIRRKKPQKRSDFTRRERKLKREQKESYILEDLET